MTSQRAGEGFGDQMPITTADRSETATARTGMSQPCADELLRYASNSPWPTSCLMMIEQQPPASEAHHVDPLDRNADERSLDPVAGA
jgi:hypothetical protein